MSKTIFSFAMLISFFCSKPVSAQISFNWNEWFKQKKTQKKYMFSQIAQLQLYIGVLKKGYSIAESGLKTVHAVRDGEFNLHNVFYGDQLRVNPTIAGMPAAVIAVSHSQYIYRNARHFLRQIARENSLQPHQRSFLESTCNNLIADVDKNIQVLTGVLSPGKYQLTDHERIKRIDDVLLESQKQLRFAKVFFNDARIIAFSKRSEKIEGEVIDNLYHFKE